MKSKTIEPLYRKVNTRARNVRHAFGGDYKHIRNTKREKTSETKRGTMPRDARRGLDYTPLFRFLLSRVGEDWSAIFSEAKMRLDKEEPIYWLVATTEAEKKDYVRTGENSFFSGLFVDDEGKLQFVNPTLAVEYFEPMCSCCTHTFNGIRFTKKYSDHSRAWWIEKLQARPW